MRSLAFAAVLAAGLATTPAAAADSVTMYCRLGNNGICDATGTRTGLVYLVYTQTTSHDCRIGTMTGTMSGVVTGTFSLSYTAGAVVVRTAGDVDGGGTGVISVFGCSGTARTLVLTIAGT